MIVVLMDTPWVSGGDGLTCGISTQSARDIRNSSATSRNREFIAVPSSSFNVATKLVESAFVLQLQLPARVAYRGRSVFQGCRCIAISQTILQSCASAEGRTGACR